MIWFVRFARFLDLSRFLFNTVPELTQATTNGVSLLGTLQAPLLPMWLSNNPLPDGTPWGERTIWNTNPYTQSPTTGVVRNYYFTISRRALMPDGYSKPMLVVNGQFPGPMIEANWGDEIRVTVYNNITSPREGTSLHWHGFLQTGTPYMDGVPSISQCPIAPGEEFTYQFKAELYGTTWYHAHYSAQYSDGAVGPLVVYGPNNTWYDYDLGPIMLSDWYHTTTYLSTVNYTVMGGPPRPPPMITSDNNLINGKMNFDCSTVTTGTPCVSNAGMAKFRFLTGKRHRLRLINTAADASQQFSIDGHIMTIIANDFVPVKPYNTTIVTLGIGQRTDVLVTATGSTNSSYFMRSNITCSYSKQPYALGVIYYPSANTNSTSTSTPWPNSSPGCANDALVSTIPEYAIQPPIPTTIITVNITVGQNSTGSWLWNMTASGPNSSYFLNSSFRGDYNAPTLLLANAGNTSYPNTDHWNVINTGQNTSYRFIVNNLTPAWHPMHFHGHNFYVLNVGMGSWDGSTTVRPSNPQRRDVQMVPAGGYMVWQADANNPGNWPFHCHIAWHSGAGLFVDVLERPNDVRTLQIPEASMDVCRQWWSFSGQGIGVVDQIDSGE